MSEPAVQIETPATGEYLAVVRAAATGLAAGLDFTYEQIDDLRIAVDEACAQLLAHRSGEGVLRVTYSVDGATLSVEATVDRLDKDVALHLVEVKGYESGMVALRYEVRR